MEFDCAAVLFGRDGELLIVHEGVHIVLHSAHL
jgi:hypothetical protein